MAKVAKAFNTANRRFAVGDDVEESDIPADNPVSFDDYRKKHFIATAPTVVKKIEHDVKAAEREEAKAAKK